MFSKIERGDRRAKREQVIKLAESKNCTFLKKKKVLIVDDEQERDLCNDAIIIAQKKIKAM